MFNFCGLGFGSLVAGCFRSFSFDACDEEDSASDTLIEITEVAEFGLFAVEEVDGFGICEVEAVAEIGVRVRSNDMSIEVILSI